LAKQTLTGKAFEYANLISLYNHLIKSQKVEFVETPAFNTAKTSYNLSEKKLKENLDLAAKAAIKILLKMEPQLESPSNNEPLFLSIQGDAKGQIGDVRDILTVRQQNNWEIGISCKHNHSAVKHSRLSANIDFGKTWLDKPASQQYFDEITPIFNELEQLQKKNILWREIEDKEKRFYLPLLKSFMDELKRLDEQNPQIIPNKLLKYLLGCHDFYKIIANDAQRTTKIQAFNINNTLGNSAGNIRPQIKVPSLTMPHFFHSINLKPNSNTTIHIVCDEGWSISLRIHNASSKVEPSLKFDVRLEGISSKLYSHDEYWD